MQSQNYLQPQKHQLPEHVVQTQRIIKASSPSRGTLNTTKQQKLRRKMYERNMQKMSGVLGSS